MIMVITSEIIIMITSEIIITITCEIIMKITCEIIMMIRCKSMEVYTARLPGPRITGCGKEEGPTDLTHPKTNCAIFGPQAFFQLFS